MKAFEIRLDALAVLVATVTATGSAPAVQTPVPRTEALPTARACALEDFGTPLPTNALVTPEPTLFQEMGRIAEWTDGSLYSTGPQSGLHGARGEPCEMKTWFFPTRALEWLPGVSAQR